MATANLSISGASWTKAVEAAVENVLISARTVEQVEFATTAADAAPSATLQGHVLRSGDALSRAVIGPGYVWARPVNAGAVVLAVTAW